MYEESYSAPKVAIGPEDNNHITTRSNTAVETSVYL